MRFLFLTLYGYESDFYGRVSRHLADAGHDVAHVTWSRKSARGLAAMGLAVHLLPELLREAAQGQDLEVERKRIESTYAMPTLRDVYRTDWPAERLSESEAIDRTIRHFLALERIFEDVGPDLVVPEVGSETIRTASHLIALERGIDVLFLFYTIFPNPLRLYANTMHAPIVGPEEVRELSADERAEVERFIADFTRADTPIRAYREPRVHGATLRQFAGHIRSKITLDRDNEYLRPERFVVNYAREKSRAAVARRLYEPLDASSRPFVYFPLHVTDDYKIKRVIPHCVDQAAIVELIAEALPQGIDLVLKEHPMSIGRNRLGLLRRLRRRPNIRLVDPYTSSHELIRCARAVAVISSTVGLEALLHGSPVLTVGQPFYAGYGVTLDVDSFREMPEKVPALLDFRPDRERTLQFLHAAMRRCYPGRPAAVDASDENARQVAESLDAAVSRSADRDPLVAA